MRLLTAGESHGPALTGILEGLPAGLAVSKAYIDGELKRRQSGYGRGARMQIETDKAVFTAGLRASVTLGSPLCFTVENRDHPAWKDIMGADAERPYERQVTRLRPGHADFAGSVKYGFTDARNVLERASARETAVRVAAGAVAELLLRELNIEIGSHVTAIGGVTANVGTYSARALIENRGKNEFDCMDTSAVAAFKQTIDRLKAEGDTAGGTVELVVSGLPAGIGSHVHYDRKLSTALFAALGSVQSVKAVEIGLGTGYAALCGSAAHDEMDLTGGKVTRRTNHAGGIEGGMTNGEDIVLRVTLKPIPTVMKGLKTFDLVSGQSVLSEPERSDCCAVPAAAVVLEKAVALTVAEHVLEVCGGDTMATVKERFFALPGHQYR